MSPQRQSKPAWIDLLQFGWHGTAVEGADDQKIIEAFLDVGRALWGDWTQKLKIESVGGFAQVRKQVAQNPGRIWGYYRS